MYSDETENKIGLWIVTLAKRHGERCSLFLLCLVQLMLKYHCKHLYVFVLRVQLGTGQLWKTFRKSLHDLFHLEMYICVYVIIIQSNELTWSSIVIMWCVHLIISLICLLCNLPPDVCCVQSLLSAILKLKIRTKASHPYFFNDLHPKTRRKSRR